MKTASGFRLESAAVFCRVYSDYTISRTLSYSTTFFGATWTD
jgi:hypothetical protein